MLPLAGCGDIIIQALVALQQAPITEVRVAGSSFLTLSSKTDSADRHSAENGFLCVKHSPGCGITGNSGLDDFFGPGKPLPLLAQIVGVDFMPASAPVAAGIGGYGSFGADLKTVFPDGQTATQVDWRNACQGVAAGKDLYYRISFRVRIRGDASQLGEQTVDPTATPTAACGDMPTTPPPSAPIASGLLGIVKYCNPTPQVASGTLMLMGSCSPAQPGAMFSCTMNEMIPVTFQPAGGGQPSSTNFMTKQIYQQGSWTLATAKVEGLTSAKGPLTIQVPGGLGTPVLDFTTGSCPP